MQGAAEWFLSAEERGNPATTVNHDGEPDRAWTVGNRVEPLIHGATYFSRLVGCLSMLGPGDQVLLVDWRGGDDELLGPSGPRAEGLRSKGSSGAPTRRCSDSTKERPALSPAS